VWRGIGEAIDDRPFLAGLAHRRFAPLLDLGCFVAPLLGSNQANEFPGPAAPEPLFHPCAYPVCAGKPRCDRPGSAGQPMNLR